MRYLLAAAIALWCSLSTAVVRAEFPTFVHVVREGETLASIAQRYYGDPRRESVLVAENGLETQGGVPIVIGLRLVVPAVAYHRVGSGETWGSIAERYYGVGTRAFVIQDANPAVEGAQPPEGAELLVPYPLRHVADQRATIQRVAQQYFEDARAATSLRRFNNLRGTRLTRGQVILVPLADLVMSEEGRRIVAEAMPVAAPQDTAGELRELQERISSELPVLQEAVRRGQYTEAIAMGNRLLGAGELTGNQIVTIQRALAIAYVAVDRNDLAIAAFVEALTRQPDLELDSRRTSPTVLTAFESARTQLAAAVPIAEDAGVDAPTAP
ncbi:MAG: LysM peptidoglycan-binding domain-containing protein [Deltaproteobacteria bacterium]|nr:LysM peptidoglycan-binding domain-containing protein [Deltaproteobacteria bacterium]